MKLEKQEVPDLWQVKSSCNGMLPIAVYREIYKEAAEVRDGTLAIEVGAAHGAATIAMSLGANLASSSIEKIVAFETLLGGSREQYGCAEVNKQILLNNLRKYRCSNAHVIFDTAEDGFRELGGNNLDIGLLLLDADGAIDREMALFYDHLRVGAPVIIDDYDDVVHCAKAGKGRMSINAKHKITKCLVDYYVAEGYLAEVQVIRNTWFGRKTFTNRAISNARPEQVYRQSIFLQSRLVRTDSWLYRARIGIAVRFPKLHRIISAVRIRHTRL